MPDHETAPCHHQCKGWCQRCDMPIIPGPAVKVGDPALPIRSASNMAQDCNACDNGLIGFCPKTLVDVLAAASGGCTKYVPARAALGAQVTSLAITTQFPAPFSDDEVKKFFRAGETREQTKISRSVFVALLTRMLYRFQQQANPSEEKSFATWLARFDDFAAFGD